MYCLLFQTQIQVLRTLLGQQLQKGKINRADAQEILNEMQDNIQAATRKLQDEKDEKEKVALLIIHSP